MDGWMDQYKVELVRIVVVVKIAGEFQPMLLLTFLFGPLDAIFFGKKKFSHLRCEKTIIDC